VDCTWCQGRGYRERIETRTEQDPVHGGMVVKTYPVRENCTCLAGRVDCSRCSGRGRVTCDECQGSGRVKAFELLNITFRQETLTDVQDPTGMPDHLVGKAKGEVVIHEHAECVNQFATIKPEVDQRIHALLQKSQAIKTSESRLLFQELHVERVNIQEVVYRYRQSDIKRLWIYGEDQCIYAPGVPRPWNKFFLIVAGVLALFGAGLLIASSL
jgi:hypothetical protein